MKLSNIRFDYNTAERNFEHIIYEFSVDLNLKSSSKDIVNSAL